MTPARDHVDDSMWAQRLLDPTDDAAWERVRDLANRMARHAVAGGARFDADDVAARALHRLVQDPQRVLGRVISGDLPLHAVIKRLVTNAHFDLTREQNRANRRAGADRALDGVTDAGYTPNEAAQPTQLWAALMRSNPALLAYRAAIDVIHELGATWACSTPQYPLLLLAERTMVRNGIQKLVQSQQITGVPADAAAAVVAWPPAVGATPVGAITLDAAAGLGSVTDATLSGATEIPLQRSSNGVAAPGPVSARRRVTSGWRPTSRIGPSRLSGPCRRRGSKVERRSLPIAPTQSTRGVSAMNIKTTARVVIIVAEAVLAVIQATKR